MIQLLERIAAAVEKPQIQAVQPVVHSVQSVDKPEIVVIEGVSYDSPKLFQVINWLKANPEKRDFTVRQIAEITALVSHG